MLSGDTVTRDMLADLIRGAVDDTVKEQIARRAQEPPISSKIATTIEARLDGMEINGHSVSVVVQDFPDRGLGWLESKSGADLYIGIWVKPRLKGMPPVAMGLLIQAKTERAITHSRAAGPSPRVRSADDVVSQCGKMVARTDKGSRGSVGRAHRAADPCGRRRDVRARPHTDTQPIVERLRAVALAAG